MTPSINRRGESLHSLEKKFSCYLNKKRKKKKKKVFLLLASNDTIKKKKKYQTDDNILSGSGFYESYLWGELPEVQLRTYILILNSQFMLFLTLS